ncbi:amino acid adenylation [Trichoderma cornu-damae]|uniref:Amino acid adenylation n=1 Tax=Trichoderma cornu-damae TaxID=654480 RepID=A0A9P8TUC3_9HYPO|nr:amino acid adenylation [Trichoderma cornu-damae]
METSSRYLDYTAMQCGPKIPCPFPTVTSSFYHHATSFPDNVALHDLSGATTQQITYRQLAARAQALAAKLRTLGVRPHHRVPLVVKRSAEMVVGIWAVLSCGAQYVPLDGGVVPDSTIRHVFEQSSGNIICCLTSTVQRIRHLCPGATPVIIEQQQQQRRRQHLENLPCDGEWIDLATSESGCYIIYTSGTTGKPKGVDVTHKNVANLVCMSPGNLGIRPGNRVGQVLNISFDMAAWEIFACLCNGGTLVIRGPKWEPAIELLDTLICTPTILSKYSPTNYPKIRVVATAGEPTSQELADLWAKHATYWNCCGPTETTIVNTMQKLVVGDGLSIGRPTPNNNVYILNGNGDPVPVGESGTMWAGGHGVSRGYVGLEAKTNESYIPDPFANDGSKMYCTGDLGRWRPDGSIEILGRVDDQVKIKGFRVELDGVSSSMASAPGVTRACALSIDGEIHGFVVPSDQDAEAILEHTRRLQPYYAVPSSVHLLDEFPTTANGKIDKKSLRVLATRPASPAISESSTVFISPEFESAALPKSSSGRSSPSAHVRSVSSSSTLIAASAGVQGGRVEEEEEEPDLTGSIPEKKWPKLWRGLRKRILIVYRVLFSFVSLINIGVLIAVILLRPKAEWLATITAANLVTGVLVRQEAAINTLYTVCCSVPKSFPFWIRRRCAKIYHLGGVHSGAGFCASAWLVASTVQATIARFQLHGRPSGASLANLVISWLLCALCCAILASAWPTFRKAEHNMFEKMHRFLGWTALALFWVKTAVSVYEFTPAGGDLGMALVKTPAFWMLGIATCSVASSWIFLRKVKVNAEPLSDHAIRLHFDYTVPVNGSFTRISHRPLLEWHSFATIPAPQPSPEDGIAPGYSLIISNAGDWTKSCIQNPPTSIWVRGLPTCGVMRIATLFNRIVVIATGSGIGPLLGHIGRPSCPTQLIWSAPSPERTFGKKIIDAIKGTIPGAVIHDTRTRGRPDLVTMGYNLARDFGAEAVIIIANEKITKKVVYGLETRGTPAFGAIWDS